MGSKRRRSSRTKELISDTSEGSKKKGKSSSDRISELPEPILQHLLSYLSPKDAFRSSTLSKSWRYICSTRPKFELRESFFNGNRDAFFSFLGKTLSRYLDQNNCLPEFLLEISSNVDSELRFLLETWIPLVSVLLGMGMKKFTLNFICNYFFNCDRLSLFHYDLAEIVFKAESLEELHLTGCDFSRINHTNKVMFNHLRKLSLANFCISEVTLERIICSCPLIDHVAIASCDGLGDIKVNKAARKLKSFDFVNVLTHEFKKYSIEIDVPSIEHIRIVNRWDWLHSADYLSFTHLKSLYLGSVRLSENSFHRFSVDFCCLEKLTLRYCDGFEGMKLASRSIKNLSLFLYKRSMLRKAAIDVPNIHSFELSCVSLPSISFTTAASQSREWKSKISVLPYGDQSSMLPGIYELHKAALCHSQFSLQIPILWGVWGDDARSYPPVVVENLTIQLKQWVISLGGFFCHLFCFFRPRNIQHFWYANPENYNEKAHNQLVECLRETLLEDNHQGLEQVLVESSNEDGNEAEDNRKRKIQFRLKWRE